MYLYVLEKNDKEYRIEQLFNNKQEFVDSIKSEEFSITTEDGKKEFHINEVFCKPSKEHSIKDFFIAFSLIFLLIFMTSVFIGLIASVGLIYIVIREHLQYKKENNQSKIFNESLIKVKDS
jgi:hypothetical protein